MEDKDVGKLWRKWFKQQQSNSDAKAGIMLIRMLVDDRRFTDYIGDMGERTRRACESFDIPIEEFNTAAEELKHG